jgi:hypothetical protein
VTRSWHDGRTAFNFAAYGYTDEQIEAMSTLQREAEVEDAIAAGVKLSGDTDSAEPEIQVRGKNQDLQWPLWPFALAAAVTLSGFYWLYAPEPEKEVASARSSRGAWLASTERYMSLTSFDSVRELSLESDHSVTMTTERRASEKPDVARGTWAFDAQSGQYTVKLAGEETAYSLVAVDAANLCMLIKGGPVSESLVRAGSLSPSIAEITMTGNPPVDGWGEGWGEGVRPSR